jgi:hypothetical protein
VEGVVQILRQPRAFPDIRWDSPSDVFSCDSVWSVPQNGFIPITADRDRTAASTGGVGHLAHLLGGNFDVDDGVGGREVRATRCRRDGDHVVLLDEPAERDLRRRLVVAVADRGEGVVVEDAAAGQRL